ncbi:MAG: tetratricopeptide repeat protein [Gallionella sp.]|nr:tetratricopeptide repeat protein [Gallionella sp.]
MAQIQGNGNISVHIAGDDNHVAIGLLPKLEITCYYSRHKRNSKLDKLLDLDKLSPYSCYSPLLGRAAELASLQAFLQDERSLLCRVLIGGGGCGKTRLALELCERASGWQAGFVTHKELARLMALQNFSAWGWQKPTLLVIDYAAAQAPLLATLLEALADRTDYPHPLRILLLERHASTESGWWQQVFASGGYAASSKLALLDPPEPVSLAPLYQVEDRLALLAAMLEDHPVKDFLAQVDFQAQLMSLSWGGDPLYLMMAALGMRQHGAQVLTLNRTDLAGLIASHEENRLVQLAHHLGDTRLLFHLVACVTLMQGMDYADFLDFAKTEKQALGHSNSGGDAAQLAELLQAAMPREDGGIAPLLPDLIGEAWLLRTWKKPSDHAAILRAYQRHPQRVVPSLIRCAQDFYPHKTTPLNWLQAVLQSIQHDADALEWLYANLPIDSVALRDFNLQVVQRLSELPQQVPHIQADRYNNLSVALVKAGKPEAALTAARQSAALYRPLAAQRPDVFQPNLARSLNNLSNILGELGQREAALQSAREAIEIRRQLAVQHPDVFLPDFASSLNNLSNRLRKLGEHVAALAAAREGVDLYRQLAAQRPDVFQFDLATSNNTCAVILSELGRREDALTEIQRAVEIRRQLAARHPDVYQSYLAMSLSNLAAMHRELRQHEDAFVAAREAANLYRQLATNCSNLFRADLAKSLNTLAVTLSELGQNKSALAAACEAVDLYRPLTALHADVFQAELAMLLNTLAAMLKEQGQTEAALRATHEAVYTLQADFFRRPAVFTNWMGTFLHNYFQICQEAEQEPDLALLEPLLPYFTNPEE